MHSFETEIIENTVDKLIKGEDYREEIIGSINAAFFDFCLLFFKKVVEAKFQSRTLDLQWYKQSFINDPHLGSDEFIINSGLNKKTIYNTYGTVRKSVAIEVANNNINYLESLLGELDNSEINININLQYNGVQVNLDLLESLIVINTLATKKLAIRGGAWSSIGKKVEKPLINRLCDLANVPLTNRASGNFVPNLELDFDREVDYKLISSNQDTYRIEVKLMGKGNPESADATIARDTDIFIADTLSQQNKNQLTSLGIRYVELKNNSQSLVDFNKILADLNIPND